MQSYKIAQSYRKALVSLRLIIVLFIKELHSRVYRGEISNLLGWLYMERHAVPTVAKMEKCVPLHLYIRKRVVWEEEQKEGICILWDRSVYIKGTAAGECKQEECLVITYLAVLLSCHIIWRASPCLLTVIWLTNGHSTPSPNSPIRNSCQTPFSFCGTNNRPQ